MDGRSDPDRLATAWQAGHAPDSSTTGVLDPAMLAELCALEEAGEPGLLAELVDLFEQDSLARLAALRAGIARGDAMAVAREAHALKGSSGNIGAPRLQGVCAELVTLGRGGALDGASELLGRAEEEFGRAVVSLRAAVAQARPARA
jgi:two-component system, sensor histidine kinase and response regulator